MRWLDRGAGDGGQRLAEAGAGGQTGSGALLCVPLLLLGGVDLLMELQIRRASGRAPSPVAGRESGGGSWSRQGDFCRA